MRIHLWISMYKIRALISMRVCPPMDIRACTSKHSHAASQKVPELAQEQGEPALRMHFSGGLTRSRPGPEAEIQKLEPGSRPEIQIVQSQKKSAPKPAKNPDSQQINPEAGPKSRPKKKHEKSKHLKKQQKKINISSCAPPGAYPRVSARIRRPRPERVSARIRAYPRFCCFSNVFPFFVCFCVFGSVF